MTANYLILRAGFAATLARALEIVTTRLGRVDIFAYVTDLCAQRFMYDAVASLDHDDEVLEKVVRHAELRALRLQSAADVRRAVRALDALALATAVSELGRFPRSSQICVDAVARLRGKRAAVSELEAAGVHAELLSAIGSSDAWARLEPGQMSADDCPAASFACGAVVELLHFALMVSTDPAGVGTALVSALPAQGAGMEHAAALRLALNQP